MIVDRFTGALLVVKVEKKPGKEKISLLKENVNNEEEEEEDKDEDEEDEGSIVGVISRYECTDKQTDRMSCDTHQGVM